jgi:hypothetical protein
MGFDFFVKEKNIFQMLQKTLIIFVENACFLYLIVNWDTIYFYQNIPS